MNVVYGIASAALLTFIVTFILLAPGIIQGQRDRRARKNRVPADPAGWGWITQAEKDRFNEIVQYETTGGAP